MSLQNTTISHVGIGFNRIRKMSGDITISHYYTKANGNSLNDYYNRTIKNKQAEIDRSHDPLTIIRLEREMKNCSNAVRTSR